MPRRLLEEVSGQRNPSEEKRINEEAEKRRNEQELQKLKDFAELMCHVP